MKTKEIIQNRKLGISIELDASEIYPNDPGQGTPVLICLPNGETVTWNCGINEGETVEGTKFTVEQAAWLNSQSDRVDAWFDRQSRLANVGLEKRTVGDCGTFED